MELPANYETVLITYQTKVKYPDRYYGYYVDEVVTRRAIFGTGGYYDAQDKYIQPPNGHFSVPQKWKVMHFISGWSALLPEGHYSYGRVLPEDIIKWEPINE
jgi:hypothetical protein